jgi:hypothetical protein
MARATQPTIDRARDLVERETTLVEREREAFVRFLARLDEMDTPQLEGSVAASGGPVALAAPETTPSAQLRTARTAYRETVMAVSHYEQEYGDTLRESVAAEFGDALAGHLTERERLTPAVYSALLEAGERAREDRTEFLRRLRRELESLETAAAELNEIEVRVVELSERVDAASTSARLADIDSSLAALEQRCTDCANSRQATIHGRSSGVTAGVDEASLIQYLYAGETQTVTPVLSDVGSRLDAIRHQRARCLR